MLIDGLSSVSDKILLLNKDENGREVFAHSVTSGYFVGDSLFYPNVKIASLDSNVAINPLDERIMSLGDLDLEKRVDDVSVKKFSAFKDPVFFFIYNTDNYYHFIYDTLPIITSYFLLKNDYPSLKLLIQYPNAQRQSLYKFVEEFLLLCGVKTEDLVFAKRDVIYDRIFISSSYTHGIDSNLAPRNEVYDLYSKLVDKVYKSNPVGEKIYISRRTWINKSFSNIGTNYTDRRKLSNEDDLVKILLKNDYREVFAEDLSSLDKIRLFNSSSKVVGAIGGGMASCLFCRPNTDVISIISPTFFEKHTRFKHCFRGKNNTFFDKTRHVDDSEWKVGMRIKNQKANIVGEIINVSKDEINVSYCDENVAGWNRNLDLKIKTVPKKDCVKLDNGLNCEWTVDLNALSEVI